MADFAAEFEAELGGVPERDLAAELAAALSGGGTDTAAEARVSALEAELAAALAGEESERTERETVDEVAELAEAAVLPESAAQPEREAEPDASPAPPAGNPALEEARSSHPLEAQLEALLLVADEPLGAVSLATAVDRPVREVRRALEQLVAEYNGQTGGPRRGFELREVAGGYRYYVRESLDPLVADFVLQQSTTKLSQAALETLAVIAYRQPISRGAIASVRAVNVDSVVRTLAARGLITEVGHDAETGAILYGTDDTLLGYLGISSVDELPPLAPLLDDPNEGFEE